MSCTSLSDYPVQNKQNESLQSPEIQSKTNRMKAFKAQKCSGSNSAAPSRTNGSPATKEQAGKEGNMEKAEGEEERIADS